MSVPGKYGRSLLDGLVLIPFCDRTDSCVTLGGTFTGGKCAEQIWMGCGRLLPFPPYRYFAMQKALFFFFFTAWKLLV